MQHPAPGTIEPRPSNDPLNIAIIVGTTRPGRNADAVARWLHTLACQRHDATFEIVDIADYALPNLDEPIPAMAGQYSHPHTQRWAQKIGAFDAYVFVTPEYNHSIPGALKNAIDFLFAEWNDKAAAIVSYGHAGGISATEHLRAIMAELKLAAVRSNVSLTFADDFQGYTQFTPSAPRATAVAGMLDDLLSWGTALNTVRRQANPQ